ncbi:MAG: hypothetical protein U5L98_17285 [Halomonas sp.]|uniref:hypothetical protein n=1 Tax=Halomonas sp. TaxID=1486246 RepID=UPI002ACE63BF|nr:hypothetical protein [Halomonas sp.]MDZ7854329.1 hypothetical protein [Halomonas sp.]
MLAYLLPKADPLEKVTVLPRGRALGVTAQVPDEERYNHGEAYLRDRITVMFGGRLAESIRSSGRCPAAPRKNSSRPRSWHGAWWHAGG